MYHDIDKNTGANISNLEHLKQSIADILITPLGSRLKRRDYGSALPFMVDQPTNASTLVRLYVAIATAIRRHEPRFQVTHVNVAVGAAPGQIIYRLEGIAVLAGRKINTQKLEIEG